MGTISPSDFLVETARVAKAIELLQTGIGAATDANTPGKGGTNALTAITALTDPEQLNALLPSAVRLADAAVYQNYYYGAWFDFMRALNDHVGGINEYLAANGLYVHYLVRAAYPSIQVRRTFPPVTDFGSMAVTGAGAGTWTPQDTVDSTLYGDGLIEVVTESVIGAADIELTITGTDWNGNASAVTCTIPATTANDTTIAVSGLDRFVTVDADPTFTGGTNADAFRIQTKLDRAPTGCA